MLLDRIDIDAHGPLHHVELGPFAEHLNVIFGPQGSGKTAITRFIRDSLVQREYPRGMLSASSGRVVWADRNGLVHCRREQDGTVIGRRSVEFESRGETVRDLGVQGQSWFSDLRASTASSRAIQSLQLPESIVDGVITDTAINSIARVVSACVRAGLDSPETYQSLPLHEASTYHSRDEYSPIDPVHDGIDNRDYDRNRRLRQELAEIEAELSRVGDRTQREFHQARTEPSGDVRWNDRLSQLHDRSRQLRAQQSELRRWIAEIDRERDNSTYHGKQFESAEYQYATAFTDENVRRRLDDFDAQMIRWRRALSEVRGLRNAVLSGEYRHSDAHSDWSTNEASLRQMRRDGFMHAVDRYDRSRGSASQFSESHRPIHQIDDIDYRIESATRQIDWLLERYADPQSIQYNWYQPLPESSAYPGTFSGTTSLGDTLRHIRQDLDHVRASTFAATRQSDNLHTDNPQTDNPQTDNPQTDNHRAGELDELQHSERWLVAAISQLNRHRESLLHDAARQQDSETTAWTREGRYDSYVLHRDRRESVRQLNQVNTELDSCLREAAAVRQSMKLLPIIDRRWNDDHGIESLRRRRNEILEQLRVVHRPVVSRSPLADSASGWLVRLSGGRLHQIAWPHRMFRGDRRSHHRDTHQQTGVTIDGRDEQQCSPADRAMSVLAVRMAVGDLLARTGRHVPLVLETEGELFKQVHNNPYNQAPLAYFDNGDLTRSNTPLASALRDYSRAGRQVVLFTSNEPLASQLTRVGARSYKLHASPVVHAHRPLWKPHYEAEHYVGPHPHTYGHRGADEILDRDRHFHDVTAGPIRYRSSAPAGVGDINRDFDLAWHEAYGMGEAHDRSPNIRVSNDHVSYDRVSGERTDWSRDGYELRDGYYVANSYTTNQPVEQGCCNHNESIDTDGQHSCCNHKPERTIAEPVSPFFLTVDSPIDQAPSIDAVAAARLRGVKVTHVNHLMQQDSNRLADALGLASVDASTVRRWQAECRLVCRVPQLRGFDARVLVGCGVTTPAQLAAIHPVDLLQQVEAFLASDRGQQILLSGSSHELSRITSWIAAANSSDDEHAYFGRDRQSGRGRRSRQNGAVRSNLRATTDDSDFAFDSDRYEYESENGADGLPRSRRSDRRRILRSNGSSGSGRKSSRNGRTTSDRTSLGRTGSSRSSGSSNRSSRSGSSSRSNGTSSGVGSSRSSRSNGTSRSNSNRSSSRRSSGSGNGSGTGRGSGSGSGTGRSSRRTSSRSDRATRDFVQNDRESKTRDYESGQRSYDRSEREPRADREPRAEREPREERDTERELRFYLQRENPVVDAPSIGARMAERLNAVGIYTVDDLLNADAETVASELDHRRVDADIVLQWQQQSTLVCRVPMLRGHDAQLLVLAEITTPEELADCNAEELFGIVDPIARSSDGKRIVRGGKLPDLEEVTDWISFGIQHRELMAA